MQISLSSTLMWLAALASIGSVAAMVIVTSTPTVTPNTSTSTPTPTPTPTPTSYYSIDPDHIHETCNSGFHSIYLNESNGNITLIGSVEVEHIHEDYGVEHFDYCPTPTPDPSIPTATPRPDVCERALIRNPTFNLDAATVEYSGTTPFRIANIQQVANWSMDISRTNCSVSIPVTVSVYYQYGTPVSLYNSAVSHSSLSGSMNITSATWSESNNGAPIDHIRTTSDRYEFTITDDIGTVSIWVEGDPPQIASPFHTVPSTPTPTPQTADIPTATPSPTATPNIEGCEITEIDDVRVDKNGSWNTRWLSGNTNFVVEADTIALITRMQVTQACIDAGYIPSIYVVYNSSLDSNFTRAYSVSAQSGWNCFNSICTKHNFYSGSGGMVIAEQYDSTGTANNINLSSNYAGTGSVSSSNITLNLGDPPSFPEDELPPTPTPTPRPIPIPTPTPTPTQTNTPTPTPTPVWPVASISNISVSSDPGTDQTYISGNTITVRVLFDMSITVSGSPSLRLRVGSTDEIMTYTGQSGNTLSFDYTVQDGDLDTNGVSLPSNPLSGTITTNAPGSMPANLNHGGLSNQGGHRVDAVPPRLESLTVSSTPSGSNNYYIYDTTITLRALFDENVTITGNPGFNLGIASGNASMNARVGDNDIYFDYVVGDGDYDSNGISYAANSFSLNGGSVTDGFGNSASSYSHNGMSDNASHKVDGIRPQATGIGVWSSSNEHDYYILDDTIDIRIVFDDNVVVNEGENGEQPEIFMQLDSDTTTMEYSGDGQSASTTIFSYTVRAPEEDHTGLSIRAGDFGFPGSSSITDLNGNGVFPAVHPGLLEQSGHKVDAVVPTVLRYEIVSDPSSDLTYTEDDDIQVRAYFSEPIRAATTTELALLMETDTVYMSYVSATNGFSDRYVTFEHTVEDGDNAPEGISVPATHRRVGESEFKPALSEGVTDLAGNPAATAHDGIGRQSNHMVDTAKPTINSIEVSSDAGSDQTYAIDDEIEITATFSETIVQSGSPSIDVDIGAESITFDYDSTENNNALLFTYTVIENDEDTNGISIDANAFSLGSTTITDIGGNNAVVSHNAITDDNVHKVDGIHPTVESFEFKSSPTQGNTYTAGESIIIEVTFSEAVVFTGTTTIEFIMLNDIGNLSRKAIGRTSDAGTDIIAFTYLIEVGDIARNGLEIPANSIEVNGANSMITDIPGNDAVLEHDALTQDTPGEFNYVDAKPSIVVDILVIGQPNKAGSDYYIAGETITLGVVFDEAIEISLDETDDLPSLELEIGNITVESTYKGRYYADGLHFRGFRFEYEVLTGQSDDNGISVPEDSLTLGDSVGQDLYGNILIPDHNEYTYPDHKVDGIVPTVSTIEIISDPGPDDTYIAGDMIRVRTSYSEIVDLTLPTPTSSRPRLALKVESDPTAKDAHHETSNVAGTSQTYTYTVQTGDNDGDGVSIPANPIFVPAGSFKDVPGNIASNNHAGLSDQSGHKIDTKRPSITSVEITSDPQGENSYYAEGHVLEVMVTFDEPVVANASTKLLMRIASDFDNAKELGLETDASSAANATTTLVFAYEVDSTDQDRDGISITPSRPFSPTGGIITDVPGNPAPLTITPSQSITNDQDHLIDGVDTDITGIELTSDSDTNGYKIGDPLEITVSFDEDVRLVGNAPTLPLVLNTTTKSMSCVNCGNDDEFLFRYTIQSGDSGPISLDSGTLNETVKDVAGNEANPHYDSLNVPNSGYTVDGIVPTLNSYAITSDPGSDETYKAGEKIVVRVRFSENIRAASTTTLNLFIGTTTVEMTRDSVSGTDVFFGYVVQSGQNDDDGVGIPSNALSAGVEDIAGNAANGAHPGLTHQSGHKVDTTPPTITAVTLISDAGSDSTYAIGDDIEVRVTFDEDVSVSSTPTLDIAIGTGTVQAEYDSGASNAIIFTYRVAVNDEDTNGIAIPANTLVLDGATIEDIAGNPANITNTTIPDDSNHLVDGIRPTITDVTITSAPPSAYPGYGIGRDIEVTVSFSERLTLTGKTAMALEMDEGTRSMAMNWHISEGSISRLEYAYTVGEGDSDENGVSVAADAISTTGTIRDRAGNDAILTHDAVQASIIHMVDGIRPVAGMPRFTSTPGNGSTYGVGDTIIIKIPYTEDISVQGLPTITLDLGSGRTMTYDADQSDTTTLGFSYTVRSSDGRASQLRLNSGSVNVSSIIWVRDEVGNDINPAHSAATSGHGMDTDSPEIDAVAITSTPHAQNTYATGETITVAVRFNEYIAISGGSPTLNIDVGSNDRAMTYGSLRLVSSGGTSYSTITFDYTVQEDDEDDDGIAIDANAFDTPAGVSIKDFAGNAAVITHNAVSSAQLVDGVGPTITSLTLASQPSNGQTFGFGEVVKVEVSFSEDAYVTGIPHLVGKIDTSTRDVPYDSGNATTSVIFSYTVVAGDEGNFDIDAGSVVIDTNENIEDHVGNDANLSHGALTVLVGDSTEIDGAADTERPYIIAEGPLAGVEITSTTGNKAAYGIGDSIEVTTRWSEPVRVVGAVSLGLTTGNTTVQIPQVATGIQTILFRHVVAEGEVDPNGVSIDANSLTLSAPNAIQDGAGNPAIPDHKAIGDAVDHMVDGVRPSVRAIVWVSEPESSEGYKKGEMVAAKVLWTEQVEHLGQSKLMLEVKNDGTHSMPYNENSGNYEYVVEETNDVKSEMSVVGDSLTTLNGGKIRDLSENDGNLSNPRLAFGGQLRINPVEPVEPTPTPGPEDPVEPVEPTPTPVPEDPVELVPTPLPPVTTDPTVTPTPVTNQLVSPILTGSSNGRVPTETPIPTGILTITPTITATSTLTPTSIPVADVLTPTAMAISTPTQTATVNPTPTPTATVNPTPTPTATVNPTPTPTATILPTPTSNATPTTTPIPIPESTPPVGDPSIWDRIITIITTIITRILGGLRDVLTTFADAMNTLWETITTTETSILEKIFKVLTNWVSWALLGLLLLPLLLLLWRRRKKADEDDEVPDDMNRGDATSAGDEVPDDTNRGDATSEDDGVPDDMNRGDTTSAGDEIPDDTNRGDATSAGDKVPDDMNRGDATSAGDGVPDDMNRGDAASEDDDA